jgi:diguanylate cyclase (GGDEF)-like protein/PAS domain S-box-containing protein
MLPLPEPELYRAVLESMRTGVYVLDRDGRIMLWNRGAERLTGFKHYEVIGGTCRQNIIEHCNQRACVTCGGACPFGATLRDGQPRDFLIRLAHKHGHALQVLMHCAPILDAHGATAGLAQSFDQPPSADEVERKQRKLSMYGCVDDASGVPNASYTRLQLRESMTAYLEYRLPFAIIVIQVDHLSGFRSAYGHAAGDAILRVVAQTIRNSMHSGDFLGRWNEDQFLLILPNCSAHGAQIAGDRMAILVSCAKLQWWGDQHSVTTRISRTLVQEGDSLESLLERSVAGLSTAGESSSTMQEMESLRAAAAKAKG